MLLYAGTNAGRTRPLLLPLLLLHSGITHAHLHKQRHQLCCCCSAVVLVALNPLLQADTGSTKI